MRGALPNEGFDLMVMHVGTDRTKLMFLVAVGKPQVQAEAKDNDLRLPDRRGKIAGDRGIGLNTEVFGVNTPKLCRGFDSGDDVCNQTRPPCEATRP